MAASMAGIRLSKISVVLPEPETPVTAISRPLGMSKSRAWTVCKGAVDSLICPCANMASGVAVSRITGFSLSAKNPAMSELVFFATALIVPCATICPPCSPAFGPISINQSAAFKTRTSWSTNITELPWAIRSSITPNSPSTFAGCKPIDGSSNT